MKSKLAALSCATLALVVAACGSSAKPSASASSASTTAASSSSSAAATTASSAAAATTAASTATTAAATTPIKVAGLYENVGDPFWTTVSCGAQEEAKKRGADLKVYTVAGIDKAKMADNMATALLEKPNGVMASPVDVNQFVPDFQKLMKSGVPVVVSSPTDPRTEYQQVFSDSDTAKFAKDALALVPAGAGSMVVLGGAPGIPPLESRTKPFIDAVKAARPDLTALDTVYSFFDPNKVATDLTSLMLAHPDLKLVIAVAGPEGFGAASAIDKAGLAGKVGLIAFDAVPPEVDALKAGTIQALIAQNPMEVGRKQLGAVVDYLKANPGAKEVPATAKPIGVPNQLLTAKNIGDAANADYIYKAKC